MMRRFSRRRRGGASDVPINAEQSFAQILEQGLFGLRSLETLPEDVTADVPASYAAIGSGEDENGGKVLVSFAPRSAGDALLGGLIVASKLAEAETDGFAGELIVAAPQWNVAARRRLALVGQKPYRVRALAAPSLADAPVSVDPEPASAPGVVSVSSVANHLLRPADRDLFLRATVALDGLASKHGGAIRGFERSVELVIMARRVADLHADESGVVLNTVLPTRSSLRLSSDGLAGALDALEGNLRKRLNDRRTREGDEGIRSRLQPLVAEALDLHSLVNWPVGGKDLDVIDSVGVNSDGSPVATAARSNLSLAALGVILDAALELRASLPVVLAQAGAPLRLDLFRLALIAKEFAPGVARVLPLLNLSHDLVEIRSNARDRGLTVSICGSGEAVPLSSSRGRRPRSGSGAERPRRGRGEASDTEPSDDGETKSLQIKGRDARDADGSAGGSADDAKSEESSGGRGRSRRRGRRPRGGGDRDAAAAASEDGEAGGDGSAKSGRSRPQFEEMSSFDLAEEGRPEEGEGGRPRRRGRRSRGGRGRGRAEQSEDQRDGTAQAAPSQAQGEDADVEEVMDADASLEEALSELPDAIDSIDDPVAVKYDDDDNGEDDEEGGDDPGSSKKEKSEEKPVAAVVDVVAPEARKPVRRRIAIVAHGDRDSVLAAVLLARELRLVEQIWVYSQAELMTFFRGGATDLRDETPIYLIGFTPSPARDVIQAAAIYSGRLTWIDHSEWPPEDLGGLREAIGEDQVWVVAGLGTSLPLMINTFTRRSRFSDKLVDLAVGRFTEHDYERWGRVWWWRLGEIAKKSGPCKADLELLLAGRPSDLAKEAEKVEVPPPPAEVEFVSARDFRLVHFAGHSVVIVEVPDELDLNLAARIARERYHADLSLAVREGSDLVVLTGDEGVGKRALDFSSLVRHLGEKLQWVTSLADHDHDHVARFLVADRAAHPDRLDDVIGEIVMGRTLLER